MSFLSARQRIREMVSEINRENIPDPNKISCAYKECNRQLRRMRAKQKGVIPISEKRHIASSISLVTSYRRMLLRMKKTGRGISNKKSRISSRVRWEDAEMAFKSR